MGVKIKNNITCYNNYNNIAFNLYKLRLKKEKKIWKKIGWDAKYLYLRLDQVIIIK